MTKIINPFTPWRVSQGWNSTHRAVDYGTPWGTKFTAPASGIYEHLGGSLDYSSDPTDPGLYGQVRLPDGRRIIVCHLSRHLVEHRARVTVGETLIAATGNSGHVKPKPTPGQPYDGSHMHTYGLTAVGIRWNWTLDAQPGGGSAAGGDAKPFPKPQPTPEPEPEWEDDTMRIFSDTGNSFYLAKPGGIVGIRNTRDLTLLRRLLESKPGAEDKFNPAERDIIASYMRD